MNAYIEEIKPYQAASHDIWNFDKEDFSRCLKLDWNESTLPPSPKVQERILELAKDPYFFQWYPNTSNLKLLEAIGDYVGVKKENIQVFSSSDALHEYIARVWLMQGNKVLLMWPTYDNFRLTVESYGAKALYYEMDYFSFNGEKMAGLIECNKPKMVYICNPNNPTGEGIDLNCLKKIIYNNRNCLFVLDEAYVEYSGKSLAIEATKVNNLLVSRTFSKAFGLANFRIGYLVSSVDNIKAISKIRNAKSISTFAQEAAIAALDDLAYMQHYVKDVIQAREFFIKQIKKLKKNIHIYPSDANFVLMAFESSLIRDRLVDFLKEKKIFIRKLYQSNSLSKSVRISIGTMEQMKFVLKNIEEFLENYEDCGV